MSDETTTCRRCEDCDGDEHHWLTEIQHGYASEHPEHPAAKAGLVCWDVCKHCDAWRPVPDDDLDGDGYDYEDEDEDEDEVYCYHDKRVGLCCDDLCHGSGECLWAPRPWENETTGSDHE